MKNFNRALAVVSFLLGVILGAVIWALAGRFTGELEPWDSDSWYYPMTLAGAGFVAALVYPRAFWSGALGVYFGQVLYIEFAATRANAPMVTPVVAVAIFGTAPAFLGAAAAYGVWRFLVQAVFPRP